MKQSGAQILGRKGQRWFENSLPKQWIFQRPTEDFGIDGVVVIGDVGELNGTEFRVQIKSSLQWERQGEVLLVSNLKRRTIRDWIAGFSPTMLALYEEKSDSGFLYWVMDLFPKAADVKALFAETSETLTLKIPSDCPVQEGCWDFVREKLRRNYEEIISGLQAARLNATLLPLLRALSECVRNLYFVQLNWRETLSDEQKQKMLLLLESSTHKEVVIAMSRFQDVLPPDILLSRQVLSAIRFYMSKVAEFYVGFNAMVENPQKTAVVRVNPKLLVEQRPFIMNTVIDFLIRFSGVFESANRRDPVTPYDPVSNPFPYPWASILKNLDRSATPEDAGNEEKS